MPHSRTASDRLVDILVRSAQYLAGRGVEDARLEAELLLGSVLDLDRVQLYLQFDRPLSEEEKDAFRALLKRRAEGEPVQYILGGTEFYGLPLTVGPGVLIPRRETELLVQLAAERAPEGGFETAADLGCGSGAVALALLEEKVAKQVLAVDIAPAALRTTVHNAESLGYTRRDTGESSGGNGGSGAPLVWLVKQADGETRTLGVLRADAFAPGFDPPGAPFPLIVSNPPYVTDAEHNQLPEHVREHEPREALVSGGEGLDAHRGLAESLPRLLRPDGLFLGEFGADQGERVRALHEAWAGDMVMIHRDYGRLDRVVEARNSGGEA